MLSPAGTILSISADTVTQAIAGWDPVYAITADHQLWYHTSVQGWSIQSSNLFEQISSTTYPVDDAALVVGRLTDGSLWSQYPGTMLSPAGTIASLLNRQQAGVNDFTDRDTVFVLAADGSLWEYDAAGWEAMFPSLTSCGGGGQRAAAACLPRSLTDY